MTSYVAPCSRRHLATLRVAHTTTVPPLRCGLSWTVAGATSSSLGGTTYRRIAPSASR